MIALAIQERLPSSSGDTSRSIFRAIQNYHGENAYGIRVWEDIERGELSWNWENALAVGAPRLTPLLRSAVTASQDPSTPDNFVGRSVRVNFPSVSSQISESLVQNAFCSIYWATKGKQLKGTSKNWFSSPISLLSDWGETLNFRCLKWLAFVKIS